MLSIEQLAQIFPQAKLENLKKYLDALNAAMEEFGINTPPRQAMFLAQCGHESNLFSEVEENLNYRADTLVKVFPRYFADRDPEEYAHQPEKIANLVYSNRMGNGDESSGDGYRYRGRGLIQLTGHNNYQKCGETLGIDLTKNSDFLATPDGACRSAGWFWSANSLNQYADVKDNLGCTKRINGGTIGLDSRNAFYESACNVLGV